MRERAERALPISTTCERGLFIMRIYVAEVLFFHTYGGEETEFFVRAAFHDLDAAERWCDDEPARLADARKQAGRFLARWVRTRGDCWVRPMTLY